ncbi:hypothetical protein VP02_13185 [Pseudomonas ogarae]|uniref:Uncharacterized protein n=1 Tax=Pseudomonas kilonensis TaxID=132476 RepID=A0A0F4XNP8_9PSED|nr:hypothetical protein VP02_13185 [Pseudomonas ogarae]
MSQTQRLGKMLIVFARCNDADGIDQKVFYRKRIFIISVKSEQDNPATPVDPAGGCLELIANGIDDHIKLFVTLPRALKFLRAHYVQTQGLSEFNSKRIQIGRTCMDTHGTQKDLRDQAHRARAEKQYAFPRLDGRLLDVVQNTRYGFDQDGCLPAHIVRDVMHKTLVCDETLCKCAVLVDTGNVQARI